MGKFFHFSIHPISATVCEDCIQFEENICIGSFLSLPFSICIHPYRLLSSDDKYLLSLKPIVGEGQEEHQATTQSISTYYRTGLIPGWLWAIRQAKPESPWFVTCITCVWHLDLCPVRMAKAYWYFHSLSLLLGMVFYSLLIIAPCQAAVMGPVPSAYLNFIYFSLFLPFDLLPDHHSSFWSPGLLLTHSLLSLEELGRWGLSMALASWLWFHHYCSTKVYNLSLQLGKAKYPLQSPSPKG